MEILICPACNVAITETTRFCAHCGTELPDSHVLPFPRDPTNRQQVRALAEATMANLRKVAESGGNVHQFSLDQVDVIQGYIAALSPDIALRFSELYSQETNALTATTAEKTEQLIAEVAVREGNAAAVGTFIGIVIIALVFWLILSGS